MRKLRGMNIGELAGMERDSIDWEHFLRQSGLKMKRKEKKTEMNELILLSGGLDSTACLLHSLEAGNNVTPIYINLENNSAKTWCEQEAIWLVINELQKKFKIEHPESPKILIKGTASKFSQPPIWGLLASFLADSTDVEQVTIGYTKGDSIINEKMLRQVEKFWKTTWTIMSTKTAPRLNFPLIRQTKSTSLRKIRKFEKKHEMVIVDKLWTCETPVRTHSTNFSGYKPCLECLPCKRGLQIGFVHAKK